MPEYDETHIRDKVFDQISIDDLKSDDGLTILLFRLYQHLAKDDLPYSLEKMRMSMIIEDQRDRQSMSMVLFLIPNIGTQRRRKWHCHLKF